ncbi:MAG: hypothetical protein KF753_05960 [Caldilineaceae bacterium]|nr:hypothetical protein [Caldilineaceae bacterium]
MENGGTEMVNKRSRKEGGHTIATLIVLLLAALAIVFALTRTGNAANTQDRLFDSPPASPIKSPTPTPTPTATVSPLPSPTPLVAEISPSTGVVNLPHQVNIYGKHFHPNAVVRIAWESHGRSSRLADTPGYIELATSYVNAQHLIAKVPSDIAKGLYGVFVMNPDHQRSETLHAAYEAASSNPQDTDDLKSRGENLWTTPNSPAAGVSVSIGLTVYRVGGVSGLPPFAVDFYEDSVIPANRIGRGFVTGISPDSSASTSAVAWTPQTHGQVKLIAVIDPEGQVTESNEENNRIRRTVDVRYIAPEDSTPPLAQRLLVNGGENRVSDPNVTLSIEATDPAPNPTGVSRSYYVELHWASGIGVGGAWIPVKWTSWISFGDQPHPYELMPNSGLRYLQGWVADGAGNISAKPAIRQVNYVPATDTLLEGEVRVYRQATLAGQCLRVRVEPAGSRMDPDLYVWPPNYTAGDAPAGYSILEAGQTDEVVIQPTNAGVYQIEIVAFTDATYSQTIEVLESCPTVRGNSPAAPADKQPRAEPSIPVADVPVGTETAPETFRQYLNFLSLAARETQSAAVLKSIFLPSLHR